MKWRCTWCGKPHAENDPPCDTCGHNVFEEAIVRENADADVDDRRDDGTVDTGTQYMWVCADCGRQHMRNNPPCSRCGSHDLEKTEQHYDGIERELETPSWFEVAKPYLPAFAVIGLVFLLFATGVIPLSVLPGIGTPSPPDAPGESSVAAGIDLDETEPLVYDRLAAERDADIRADDDLAAYAEYQNRVLVANAYEDAGHEPADPADFDLDCSTNLVAGSVTLDDGISAYDDEDALADAVADRVLGLDTGDVDESTLAIEGVDLHVAPDDNGTVVVVYAAC